MIWLLAIIGSVTGFLFGYDEGIIAGSLDLVTHHFALSSGDIGVMAAALPFGALLGSILIGFLLASKVIHGIGRRLLLSFSGMLFFCGALGAGFAHSVSMLVLSRTVLGLAIGSASVITPLYLAEAAPARLRGAVVAIYQLAITLGIVSAYSMNYLLLEQQAWRLMFASSVIPATILGLGVFFLPESPRWLCSVGKRQAAQKSLEKLRKNREVEQEMAEIEKTLLDEPKTKAWRDLLQKHLFPVLMLGVMLCALQQLSGINVIIYYAPEIFKNLGVSNSIGQVLATMGIGIVNVLVTVIALIYVDKLGRRKLLLFGFTGTFISLALLSLFTIYQIKWLALASVICLVFYIFSFAISLGPVPFIAMAEIFPLHVRGAGMGISMAANWIFNTLVVFSFPLLEKGFGIEYTFAIYALICFAGLLYTYYFMPETKNLSLEKIENYLMAGKPLRELGRARINEELPSLELPADSFCPPYKKGLEV